MRKNGARAFTAKSRSHSLRSASASDPRSVRAAELTSESTRPNRLSAASKIRSGAVGVLQIRRDEDGRRPASLDLRRRGRAFGRVSARHHDAFGAGARGRLRDSQADALRRPGDHDHPPVHARPPLRGLLSAQSWIRNSDRQTLGAGGLARSYPSPCLLEEHVSLPPFVRTGPGRRVERHHRCSGPPIGRPARQAGTVGISVGDEVDPVGRRQFR